MLLKEFLERVLPAEGYKCWVEINQSKQVTQGLVPTLEQLAAKLTEIDARGSDAYFGCAAYATPNNRRRENVLAVKAFWLDIDAGEGKPYATADEAIQACDEFCNRCELPLPAMVRSGGGAHGYWLLDRALDSATWRAVAERLKLLTANQGFHCDPSRTADVASILRPAGTRNYKLPGTPRSVEVDSDEGWEPLDAVKFIECVLQAAALPPAGVASTQGVAEKAGGSTLFASSNTSMLAGVSTSKAFDFSKGLKEHEGRNNALAKAIGELLARGYDLESAARKCWEWNQLNEPPLDEREFATTVKSICSSHLRKHPPVLQTEELKELQQHMPHGYSFGPQQQLMVKVKVPTEDGSEKEEIQVVSDYPVYPAIFLNQEGHVKRNSYLFRAWNPLTHWNEFCLDSSIVNGRDFYVELVRNGVTLASGMDKYFKIYVREVERMLRKEHEIIRYNQFGWKGDDSFLVGDVLVEKGQPKKAYGTDRLTPLMRTMALPPDSSLESWTAAADKFFAPGMEPHAFALLCSFAAPLMKYCAGLGDGGSILSLMSPDSGKGKTPTGEAIASVWGDLNSVRVTGNFTQNRLIGDLVARCNLPLVQEEMTQADPLVATDSVKKFTMGTDRGRLDRSGAPSGIPEHYQTILISLSNISLYSMVAQVDRAASRRILEVEIEELEKDQLSNLGGIVREMMNHRGQAGRRFAQIITAPGIHAYLTEHLTGVNKDSAGSVVMHYRRELETSPEHRFVVWLLATVHVASYLLVHYGILHFDVERIMNWAVKQVGRVIIDKGFDSYLGKFNQFLASNIDTCLVVKAPFDPKKGPCLTVHEPRGHLYMRMELEPRRLFVSQAAVRQWCEKNHISFKSMGDALEKEHVLLERSKQITLGAGTRIASVRAYCWELNADHSAMSGIKCEVINLIDSASQSQ